MRSDVRVLVYDDDDNDDEEDEEDEDDADRKA